ncbi:MAG: Ig-like domain-containing protein, partial [Williamsia sp.]|nr:Ig-like domain-containing protein [Williamsia sp.]
GNVITGVPSGILTSNTTYAITGITALNNNYCDNTSPGGLSTLISIQQLPTVSTIAVPSGGAYAQTGNTLQLSDAPPANATGAWSTNNAATATVNNTGLVTGTGEGTPTITYTVTDNTSLQCKNSTTQVVRVYNPDYITKAAGDFSSAATWQIDRDDNTFATSVPVPAGNNYTSIRVQHALNLNQDFQVRSGVNFSLITGGTMTVASGKSFSSLGTVDFANKLVTVKSDANGTGSIGQVASAIANASNVTVERYTDGGNATTGRRAWRLMTSPITGQTIRNAWQEGGATNTGFGTLITGETLTSSQATSTGFDYIGAGNHTSIKEYTNGAWVPLSTNLTTGTQIPLNSQQAYMLFVRGNRTVGATTSGLANIRANGTLRQGSQTVTMGNTAYTVVGNPYASSIDFSSIYQNNSAAIKDQFYLWNSKLGTYGAYVLVTHDGANGGYNATPAQITGVPAQNNDAYRYIPSGSGFFAIPAANASSTTLTIREADKASASNPPVNPFRVITNAANVRNLMVNLNQKNSDSTSILADGFRAKFSADYEGNEEDNSAVKPTNFNENLGLLRNGITHIVEAHDDVKTSDTLQLRMWNVSLRNYEFQIKGDNFTNTPGVKAWLEDSYLGTKQEIDLSGGVTTVGFDVKSDSGSWKSTRFR